MSSLSTAAEYIQAFADYLKTQQKSDHTIAAYQRDLVLFANWLHSTYPDVLITQATTTQIQRWLLEAESTVKASTLNRRLATLRHYYQWLVDTTELAQNPVEKTANHQLKNTTTEPLTEAEVERLLAAPDVKTALGLRDKAMLEVLYATGLRVSELVDLRLDQLDMNQGLLQAIHPNPLITTQRLIPLSHEARQCLAHYLLESRPVILAQRTSEALFVSTHAKAMTRQAFWLLVKKYAELATIRSAISPHRLRQAFASHLLNNGTDITIVQLLLGHKHPSTTQIYSHITRERLKKLHHEHHPRAQLP